MQADRVTESNEKGPGVTRAFAVEAAPPQALNTFRT